MITLIQVFCIAYYFFNAWLESLDKFYYSKDWEQQFRLYEANLPIEAKKVLKEIKNGGIKSYIEPEDFFTMFHPRGFQIHFEAMQYISTLFEKHGITMQNFDNFYFLKPSEIKVA